MSRSWATARIDVADEFGGAPSPRVDEALPVGGDLIMATLYVQVVRRHELAVLDHELTLDNGMPRRHRTVGEPRLQHTVRILLER